MCGTVGQVWAHARVKLLGKIPMPLPGWKVGGERYGGATKGPMMSVHPHLGPLKLLW